MHTSADFMRIAEAWELQEEGGHKDGSKIIRAALRIASRVMAAGVIEEELMQSFGGHPDLEAENLRRTLTLKGAAAE